MKSIIIIGGGIVGLAIARELSKVCEKMEKVDLLYKLSKVDEYILKFVATNQSIYV